MYAVNSAIFDVFDITILYAFCNTSTFIVTKVFFTSFRGFSSLLIIPTFISLALKELLQVIWGKKARIVARIDEQRKRARNKVGRKIFLIFTIFYCTPFSWSISKTAFPKSKFAFHPKLFLFFFLDKMKERITKKSGTAQKMRFLTQYYSSP